MSRGRGTRADTDREDVARAGDACYLSPRMSDENGAAAPTPADGRAAYMSPETRFHALAGPLELELGGRLTRVDVGYRTWGTLDADGGNAVVVCHALTGSADAELWWTRMFGPGRALDPDRDFIVCSNILGSCYGTTGPASIDPATGAPYLGTFPEITIRDMVRVQHALVTALGVKRIRSSTRTSSSRWSSSPRPRATRPGASGSPRRSGRRSSPTRAGTAGATTLPARRRPGSPRRG
jgi:hypothetical protein